ncbi:unnamed protein product [Schistocephalus solidus]|uniref:Uncharacterized protein n=1 Tax=Schistocephalus solidus TaxID=70667 RepID=A0A183TRG8_SCHSO|nr:unnamed protein product [Schistocephalus solidus]
MIRVAFACQALRTRAYRSPPTRVTRCQARDAVMPIDIRERERDNSQSSAVNEFPAATPTPVMGAGVGTASASAPPSDLPHAYFMGDDGKFVAGDGSKK